MHRRKRSSEEKPKDTFCGKSKTVGDAKARLTPKKFSMTLPLFAAILTLVIAGAGSLWRSRYSPDQKKFR
jgi:hypothetical protein